MKKNIYSRNFIIACGFACTLLFSCKKADVAALPDDNAAAKVDITNAMTEDLNESNAMFALVANESDNAVAATGCPEQTFSPGKGQYPLTVTNDFGTGSGCIDAFGHKRKGKIIITYSASFKTPGAVTATKFENYYVDGHQVTGNQGAENITKAGGQPTFTYAINRTFTYNNGNSRSFTSNKKLVQITGADTKTSDDDEFIWTGEAFGDDFKQGAHSTYDALIDTLNPLHTAKLCEFPKSGIVNAVVTTPSSTLNETLNYGAGTCDDSATLFYNGRTHTITLPLRFWATE